LIQMLTQKIYLRCSISYLTKQYDLNSTIALQKFKNFKDNVKRIKEHNDKGLSWWKSINEHTDLNDDEFKKYYNLVPLKREVKKKFIGIPPKSIDFDKMADQEDKNEEVIPVPQDFSHQNFLPQVRNQQYCGSCWAHATTCAIESAVAQNQGQRIPLLSVQQLIDCDSESYGCSGGFIGSALNFIVKAGGMQYESDYKYTLEQGTCRFDRNRVKVRIRGQDVCDNDGLYSETPCTKQKFKEILSKGVTGVYFATEAFRDYGGGIISLQQGECEYLDHAVAAFAWSTDRSGREFISIRNSFGLEWGDKGNFHIYYNEEVNHTCWVTNIAHRPLI